MLRPEQVQSKEHHGYVRHESHIPVMW